MKTQEKGIFRGLKGPYLRTRMSKFLQTFHTAVWPGDRRSVKFWARSKIPNSRYQWKHRKRAFFGISKAHISGPECPNFFKLFTQLYGQETDNRWNFGPDLRFRTRDINENTGKGHFFGVSKAHISGPKCPNSFKLFTKLYGQETDDRWNFGPDLRFRTRDINENTGKGHFSGSQRPISQDPNVQISSNFSHSCMARRRTIGEILGQIKDSELEISMKTQEKGIFRGLKGPYLRTRMSKFLQTFHTAVWPGDGQSVKFWARSKIPNSRYQWKHRKRAFSGSQRPISQDPNVQISSNFSHSCMARRRTIGEILGQI